MFRGTKPKRLSAPVLLQVGRSVEVQGTEFHSAEGNNVLESALEPRTVAEDLAGGGYVEEFKFSKRCSLKGVFGTRAQQEQRGDHGHEHEYSHQKGNEPPAFHVEIRTKTGPRSFDPFSKHRSLTVEVRQTSRSRVFQA